MKCRSLQTSLTLGFGLGLLGCATSQNYRNVQLPAYAGAFFSECSGKDGSVSFELFTQNKVQQVFDADWSADADGNWGLASYSPLGQTLFHLEYSQQDQKFKQSGRPIEDLGTLTVGDHRIVSLNGHEIGLRADEVTCLLSHKLPGRWLKRIVDENNTAQETVYTIVDSGRKIHLSLDKKMKRTSDAWRATIDWSLYWGLKSMRLSVKLLRDEQALVLHSDQFEQHDIRIITQEE